LDLTIWSLLLLIAVSSVLGCSSQTAAAAGSSGPKMCRLLVVDFVLRFFGLNFYFEDCIFSLGRGLQS